MVTPYSYQLECLERIQSARNVGARRGFVVMASGLGKTITTVLDVQQFERRIGKKARVLFLCHQREILEQAASAYSLVFGDKRTIGFFHGQNRFGHSCDFVFASLQTMFKRRHYFRPDEFDYVVVDESHHSKASTFEKVVAYWKPEFLLGVTATPDRLDSKNVREFYGLELYNLPLEVALARGFLTPVDYRLMSDEIALDEVLKLGDNRRLSLSALNKHLFVPKRDEEILRIVRDHMSKIENPRVIIFCSSVQHANRIAATSDDILAIHSRVKAGLRLTSLELFRQGALPIVTSVDVFNEGVDIPEANLIVFLRSTSSPTVFFQQLGRGLRRSQGKEKVIVLDFAANCERIRTVQSLRQKVLDEYDRIQTKRGLLGNDRSRPESFVIETGNFNFDERLVQVMDIIGRVYNKDFYPTWQEASAASIKLGFKSVHSYHSGYKTDPKLPYQPDQVYEGFPGWREFLDTSFYATLEEASNSAQALGLSSFEAYSVEKGYKQDPRLPSSPPDHYKDFPGWSKFLNSSRNKNHYPTWQEASKSSKLVGVRTRDEYLAVYKDDPSLPSSPHVKYSDFPGWDVFLGRV